MLNAMLAIAMIALIAVPPAMAGDDTVDIRTQHKRELAACNHRFDQGKFSLRIEYQVCLGRANAKVWARTHHWDLFLTANARDFALAEQFDIGGMTEAQYRAARARIRSDLLTEVTQRDAYRAVTRPPPPRSITCFTTDFITTCY
jgi:hypothetical protein